jgi:hypothetical protein
MYCNLHAHITSQVTAVQRALVAQMRLPEAEAPLSYLASTAELLERVKQHGVDKLAAEGGFIPGSDAALTE